MNDQDTIPGPKKNFLSDPVFNRILRVAIPFILGFGMLAGFYLLYSYERFILMTGLILLYFIPPAGKESIIPAGIAMGFNWQDICFAIIFIDAISCLFMLWNFEIICSIPVLGRRIDSLVFHGSRYLSRHHWIERFCFLGIIIFITLPLQGSGAVGSSILGRMLGMKPLLIFFAVLIGATIHSVAIGLSVYFFTVFFDMNIWFLVGFIIFLVLVTSTISLLIYLRRRRLRSSVL